MFENFEKMWNCIWIKIRKLQEQVRKASCYRKLFWPFTVRINCSSHLKIFENSWPRISKVFLTVGKNNFSNKIPEFSTISKCWWYVQSARNYQQYKVPTWIHTYVGKNLHSITSPSSNSTTEGVLKNPQNHQKCPRPYFGMPDFFPQY